MSASMPVIGVTLIPESFQYRRSYLETLARLEEAGSSPLPMDYRFTPAKTMEQKVEEYLAKLDGIFLPGNYYDIDPAAYGQPPHKETVLQPDYARGEFERYLIKRARERGVPVFGVCGGMQNIAVAYGGTLIQHIPDVNGGKVDHRLTVPGQRHAITAEPHSEFAAFLQDKDARRDDPFREKSYHMSVNSTHHQAVETAENGLQIVAKANDGIAEAVESSIGGAAPVYGTQWHIELLKDDTSKGVIRAFIEAASSFARRKEMLEEVAEKAGRKWAVSIIGQERGAPVVRM